MGGRRGKAPTISCTKVLKGVRDRASMRWQEIGTSSRVSWWRWRRRRSFLLRERLEGERTTCGPIKVGILHNRLLRFHQPYLLFTASSKVALRPSCPTSASQTALGAALRASGEGVSSTAEAARLPLLVAAHPLHPLHPLLLLLSPLNRLPLLSPATSCIKGGGGRCPEVL